MMEWPQGTAVPPPQRTATEWSFLHFYHLDHANACIHQGWVRYSPVTFALAEQIEIPEWDHTNSELSRALQYVRSHKNKYELDLGR